MENKENGTPIIEQIISMIDSKIKPVVIFKENVFFDDSFLESGMTARLTSYEKDGDGYALTADFSEFFDQNKPLMSANYFDNNGVPCLTAEQAGMIPKGMKEYIYLDLNTDSNCVDFVSSDRLELHNQYLNEVPEQDREGTSYIYWLESKVLNAQ